jgi:hypothetical protein
LEHNFPSHTFAFYFLSPLAILSCYNLPFPFVWPFSFNIPSCAPFPLYECCGLQYTSQRTGRSLCTLWTHLQTTVMSASNASHFHGLDERWKG